MINDWHSVRHFLKRGGQIWRKGHDQLRRALKKTKRGTVMWNERYRGETFAYGTEPNSFLVEHAGLLTGPVLSLAEGEGRNAVYLASLGLDVLGVDASAVGLAKAHKLAEAKGVVIRTEVVDLATYVPPAKKLRLSGLDLCTPADGGASATLPID